MDREYEQLRERIRRLEQQLGALPITMAGGGGGGNSAKLIKLTENDGEPFYSWTIQKWDENQDEPTDGTKEGEYDEKGSRAYDIYENPDLPEDYLVFAWKNPGGGLWFISDPIWEAMIDDVSSNAAFTAKLRLKEQNTTTIVSVTNLATAIDVVEGKICWLIWNGVKWKMLGYPCS